MRGLLIAFAAGLGIAGCASRTTSDVRMTDLVGSWYGSHFQPSLQAEKLHWISDERADGTFVIRFFSEHECGLKPANVETGRWALSNGLYTTMTSSVNGHPVEYVDVYQVESSDHYRRVYRSLGDERVRFEARRVDADFTPPVRACKAQGA